MKKTVFVTGAGGYIGRHAVKALCDRGARVLIPAHHAEAVDPRAERLDVDIFSGDPALFHRCGDPDVCLHLAWRDGFDHGSDAHVLELPQHYIFLRDLLHSGLGQLAVMGTMHELGAFEGEVGETSLGRPASPYAIAKAALRELCAYLCRESGAVFQWLRAYYVTGDEEHGRSVFARLLAADRRGEETFPLTSGTRRFDFLPVWELAQQLAAAVLQRQVQGVIECCSGRPVTLREETERLLRERGLHIRPVYGAYPEPPGPEAIWGSCEKIERILKGETGDDPSSSAGAVRPV